MTLSQTIKTRNNAVFCAALSAAINALAAEPRRRTMGRAITE